MSRRQSDDRLEQTERVSATKVETFERSIRTRGPILMGMVFALLFITFGFAWAGMAPLTKGATAFGRIIVETKAKKLQHQLGGTVERVLVREGQDVEGGQLLAVMETASLVRQLKAMRHQLEATRRQRQLLGEEIVVYRTLFEKQLTQKSRVLALQRQAAELEKEIYRLVATVGNLEHRVSKSEVRAPGDGRILQLAVHAKGEIVPPGGTVLEFVSTTDRLVIEARLSPSDVDEVHPGMPAYVWLTAFSRRQVPPLKAEVAWVSPDVVVDRPDAPAHYLVRVILSNPASLPGGKRNILRPGMNAEVVVVTGKQTLLDQLLEPFLRGVSRASRT